MSEETNAVQLARLDERMSLVLRELESSKDSRKVQYDAIEALRLMVSQMQTKVDTMERQLATNQPTIQEFITIKQRVVGAGWVGKMLWAAGAGLIGLAAGSREAIVHWLAGAPK